MENDITLCKRSYLIGYWDGQEEIPSRVKEVCKWKQYIPPSYPVDWEEPPVRYSPECDTSGWVSKKDDSYKFCPYCSKPIEEESK